MRCGAVSRTASPWANRKHALLSRTSLERTLARCSCAGAAIETRVVPLACGREAHCRHREASTRTGSAMAARQRSRSLREHLAREEEVRPTQRRRDARLSGIPAAAEIHVAVEDIPREVVAGAGSLGLLEEFAIFPARVVPRKPSERHPPLPCARHPDQRVCHHSPLYRRDGLSEGAGDDGDVGSGLVGGLPLREDELRRPLRDDLTGRGELRDHDRWQVPI